MVDSLHTCSKDDPLGQKGYCGGASLDPNDPSYKDGANRTSEDTYYRGQ